MRSTKCTVSFATSKKRTELVNIFAEYKRVVNFYVDYFWENPTHKMKLLEPIVNLPQIQQNTQTWFSYRMRMVAAREAIDMVNSVKSTIEWNKEQLKNTINILKSKIAKIPKNCRKNRRKINNWHKMLKSKNFQLLMIHPQKPKHNGESINASDSIVSLKPANNPSCHFDAWLHMSCLGQKKIINIPICFHFM